MIPIYQAWCAHIDITNVCRQGCVYCTRYDRHIKHKEYFMSLEKIEQALIVYKKFPSIVGIMGGEPLLHPNFDAVCDLINKHLPYGKAMLWTSIDIRKSKWFDNIVPTFANVAYNPHTEDQKNIFPHHPSTIAIKDVIKDVKLRNALIDDCWLQRKWCPTVTDDGAFFCEVAAGLAKLQGIKGWDLTYDGKEWWRRTPDEFGYQKELCRLCGMAIPMTGQLQSDNIEYMSPSFLRMLQDNNLPVGDFILFDKEITIEDIKKALPTWRPGIYKAEQLSEQFNYSTINLEEFK